MDYKEAVEYLDTPNFLASKLGLENIRELLRELGNPQDGMKYVHIAGTNGKGSTAAYMERILRESGYKTGLYTSPYIQRFSEKIRVNGEEISEENVARMAERIKEAADHLQETAGTVPTVFELVTAMAFLFFQEEKCEVVILEVGIGGRLDATNIIETSELSILTTIDYDHMDVLGNTLDKIAYEKAGIIKENGLVVMYPQRELVDRTIAEICRKQNAKLVTVDFTALKPVLLSVEGQRFHFKGYDGLEIQLLGSHQIKNAALVVTAIEELIKRGWNIPRKCIRDGLKHTRWPGRLEVIHRNPVILIDGAHNPQGVRVLADSLTKLFPHQKITFIVGILADKDYDTMVETILPLAKKFITVTPHSTRALGSGKLADVLRAKGCASVSCSTVEEAVDLSMEFCREENSGMEEVICAFGSLYYIGDVRTYLLKRICEEGMQR